MTMNKGNIAHILSRLRAQGISLNEVDGIDAIMDRKDNDMIQKIMVISRNNSQLKNLLELQNTSVEVDVISFQSDKDMRTLA